MHDAINELNSNRICPICRLQHGMSLYREPAHTRTAQLRCERCGDFDLTLEAFAVAGQLGDNVRPMISGWISDQVRMGAVPRLTADDLIQLSKRPPLRFSEKAKRLLLYAAEAGSKLGQTIRIWEPEVAARVQTFDENEIRYIADHLENHGWLALKQQGPVLYEITGDGLIKSEEWLTADAKSFQGFVAMWFDQSMLEVWLKGFSPGIQDAGYVPMRIDNKEHANKICDEIIVEIRRSRFVVADFTGQRNGVYYEAGFAAGLPIQVIWTCRKDHFADLHFDIRQYSCIDWQTPAELRNRLHNRIVALIGEGPKISQLS
jgi:hypothetical protein